MMLHEELTDKIIGAYYKVYNNLGYGFLEKVYENSLAIELKKMVLKVEQQKNIKVFYEQEQVGDYYADVLVDDLILIEIKAASALCEEHEAQLTNYLRATLIDVGLLLNFGKYPEFKRNIFENRFNLHHSQTLPRRHRGHRETMTYVTNSFQALLRKMQILFSCNLLINITLCSLSICGYEFFRLRKISGNP